MTIKRVTAVFILILLLSGIVLSFGFCGQKAAPEPAGPSQEADAIASLPAAQGGNLHYQNLVLAVSDRIIFNSSQGLLTIAKPDGSSPQPLLDAAGSSPAYNGEQLFYISGTSGGNLCKVALDGSNQVRIGQITLKYLISHGSLLYAIESDSGLPVSLKPDGTGRTVLSDAQAIALTLSGERLFITGAGSEHGLIMIDLSTGTSEVLLNRQIGSLNVEGDWLYYVDPDDGFHLAAWSLASRTGAPISDFAVDKAFIVSEGYLYFIDSAGRNQLYRLPLDGGRPLGGSAPELVVDDAVASFAVCGCYVYYQRPLDSKILRISLIDKQVMHIN